RGTAPAGLEDLAAAIASAQPHDREQLAREVGDDDLADLAGRDRPPGRLVADLDVAVALERVVHAAARLGALPGDVAGVDRRVADRLDPRVAQGGDEVVAGGGAERLAAVED